MLRVSELVALRAGDIDLVRQTVTVRRTAPGDSGYYGPVKSRAGEGRIVPVPPTPAYPGQRAGPQATYCPGPGHTEGPAMVPGQLAEGRIGGRPSSERAWCRRPTPRCYHAARRSKRRHKK